MIRISQIKLPITHTEAMLKEQIIRQLKIKPSELSSYEIVKRSVDARKKPELFFVYTVDVTCVGERKILDRAKKVHHNNIMLTKRVEYKIPPSGAEPLSASPVIVGSGPAGLFCGWLLAAAGYRPLIIERGSAALKRKQKVQEFWKYGKLKPNCNVQFGEGGAGTFSDGKLNTSVKDSSGRNRKVLELFVAAGAPKDILFEQKPHLGTDLLIQIVTNLRHQIEEMGGQFLFDTQVTDIKTEDGRIQSIELNHRRWLQTDVLVLAIGHSARDTFSMLYEKGLFMEAKSFAVGVRMEHPQSMINACQYGDKESRILGAAPYKLTSQLENGCGIYSFCMCPGGYVVNASSEPGHLAVNGMSYHARDGKNANAAMIVTVSPKDYEAYAKKWLLGQGQLGLADEMTNHPLSGMYFQRYLEQRAYLEGGGRIPVQMFEDFEHDRVTEGFGQVLPACKGAYALSNLQHVFPAFIVKSLIEGIHACGRKINGFDRPDAILSGVESRTSSPVRMPRDEAYVSNIGGIYPCGEGAGYAGGITSAAMDGLRVGEAICKKYMNFL